MLSGRLVLNFLCQLDFGCGSRGKDAAQERDDDHCSQPHVRGSLAVPVPWEGETISGLQGDQNGK